MKYYIGYTFGVEVEAEDSVTAEAKARTLIPSTSQLQQIGEVIRTQTVVEVVDDAAHKRIEELMFSMSNLHQRLDALETGEGK